MAANLPPVTPWYVCLTKPRREALAVRKLEEQGYEVFLPMLTHWEKTRAGWAKRQQVMFPRYGFVRCARPEQSIGPIRSTPGVSGLVSFGVLPAILDDGTLAAIRSLAERQARKVEEKVNPFQAGDSVEVAAGPLKGMSGIVSAVAEERVTIMLGLLGREKPVAVPVGQVTLA
ncbi:transcription termination/antitermination protein NusG [Candidatus Accumulibacter phosphatis]|jgi:transcriptional antiterminator RfaH|nr:transcription termination/antitermination NusG family protein [Candidatus Accumulibacter phosphatis]